MCTTDEQAIEDCHREIRRLRGVVRNLEEELEIERKKSSTSTASAADDDRVIEAVNVNEAMDKLLQKYRSSDVCLAEMLENTVIEGLTVSEIIRVFAKVSDIVDGDVLMKVNSEEKTCLFFVEED